MTDERIIAYLLRELPEEGLERFEDECFSQEGWPDEIDLVEGDLIEAYLRNELAPQRRELFERNYLTTEARHERVGIAAALLRHIDKQNRSGGAAAVPKPKTTWFDRIGAFLSSPTWGLRAGAAFATVIVIAGALWLSLRTPPPATFAALTLSISSSNRAEGAEAGKVKLPLNADALKVTLTLPQPSSPAASYRLELEKETGETRSVEIVGQDAQAIQLMIPVAQLQRGQYAVKLFIKKPDEPERRINGSYFFMVE